MMKVDIDNLHPSCKGIHTKEALTRLGFGNKTHEYEGKITIEVSNYVYTEGLSFVIKE